MADTPSLVTTISSKKAYSEPKLAHLGDFTSLTQGGGGVAQDGGKGSPNTKV